jgi:hypothetical protein
MVRVAAHCTMRAVTRFVAAGAGFLLAVLWFDLMHDVQVLRAPAGELPAEALESITRYYRRVLIGARPMNRLVAAAMLGTLAAVVAQIVAGETPRWAAWIALLLVASAVALAAVHTVPSAKRLGGGVDAALEQSRLARVVCRDHLYCLVAIAALLAIELAVGR